MTGAQGAWFTRGMVHKGHGAQGAWCTRCMVHKGHGAQGAWCTRGMVHKGHGSQGAVKLQGATNLVIDLQALTFVPEGNQELVDMFARWSIAYSKVLACHLREDGDVNETLEVSLQSSRLLWVLV